MSGEDDAEFRHALAAFADTVTRVEEKMVGLDDGLVRLGTIEQMIERIEALLRKIAIGLGVTP